jgi:hypothetical protein
VGPRYRRGENVVTRQIAGETLLVPIRGDLAGIQRIFALDEVSWFVWERLDGARDAESLAAEVCAVFAVTLEQAAADIRQFIGELSDAGLVTQAS